MDNQKFDLKTFLPNEIFSGAKGNKCQMVTKENEAYLSLSYFSNVSSGKYESRREYSACLKRYVNKNDETFEVIGLLQAEMGKTQNGCLNFCNHEYQIIKKVMAWFERELEIGCEDWRWYIKLNINGPTELMYKAHIENKVISYWLNKTGIKLGMKYPKTVSYIKNTKNKRLRHYDYGTLVIEYKNNLLSQVIKKFVKGVSYNLLNFDNEEIRRFMKGIIAGEGCIEISIPSKKFRVRITTKSDEERSLYQQCLARLRVESTDYPKNEDLIISKKCNLLQSLQQKLLSLSPKKYNKFLRIFQLYDSFPEYETWKQQQTKPHNKIPQEIIDKIVEIHRQDPSAPAWKIAGQTGVSAIKVQRVRIEHRLCTPKSKMTKEEASRILDSYRNNPSLTQAKLAEETGLAEHRIRRVLTKQGKSELVPLSRSVSDTC